MSKEARDYAYRAWVASKCDQKTKDRMLVAEIAAIHAEKTNPREAERIREMASWGGTINMLFGKKETNTTNEPARPHRPMTLEEKMEYERYRAGEIAKQAVNKTFFTEFVIAILVLGFVTYLVSGYIASNSIDILQAISFDLINPVSYWDAEKDTLGQFTDRFESRAFTYTFWPMYVVQVLYAAMFTKKIQMRYDALMKIRYGEEQYNKLFNR